MVCANLGIVIAQAYKQPLECESHDGSEFVLHYPLG
jgi:hypothetical protein